MESMLGDYDTPRGHPDFLETLAAFFHERLGWAMKPENIAVTTGSQRRILALLQFACSQPQAEAGSGGFCFPLVPKSSAIRTRGWRPICSGHRSENRAAREPRFQNTGWSWGDQPGYRRALHFPAHNPSSNVITDSNGGR